MAMNNLNLFSNDNVSKDGEERKDGWHCGFSINHEEWDMIDFETICQVPDPSPAFIRVSYNHHLMTAIDQLCRELIYVTFNPSRLGEEEIADHSNVVRHVDGSEPTLCAIAATLTEQGKRFNVGAQGGAEVRSRVKSLKGTRYLLGSACKVVSYHTKYYEDLPGCLT